MAEQEWNRIGLDEVERAGRDRMILGASAFGLGVVTGLFLKGAVEQLQERVRARRWHHEHEQTVTYHDNLPDSLARREPGPESGQPRFGGTGALGVHPAAAGAAQPREGHRGE